MTTIKPYEDGTMTVESQGVFAPEVLLSDAYSRRFIGTPKDGRADYLVITDYYAVVTTNLGYSHGEPPRDIVIQNCTEFFWTDDHEAMDEVDSDYSWGDSDGNYQSVEAAERAIIRELGYWGLETWAHHFATP